MTTHTDSLFDWLRRSGAQPADDQATDKTASTTTGGGSEHDPVVVWQAANRMEAQIVKGRLESEGIPAIIRGDIVGAIYGLTTGSLAAADVLVPAPLAQKAIEILQTEVTWDDFDPGDEAAPEG